MQEMDAALILTKQDVLIFFIKGDKRYNQNERVDCCQSDSKQILRNYRWKI